MVAIRNVLLNAWVLIILLIPAYGQEETRPGDLAKENLKLQVQEGAFLMAEDLSRCAALYGSLGDFTFSLGEADKAQVFNDQSNSAKTAAEVFAKVYAGIERYGDFVKDQYDGVYPRLRALLRDSGEGDHNIQMAVTFCRSLRPIQNEVVEEVRRKARGADTSGDEWVK